MSADPETSSPASVSIPMAASAGTGSGPASGGGSGEKRSTPRIGDFRRQVIVRRVVSVALILVMSKYFVAADWHDVFQYHPLLMCVAFCGFLPEVLHLSNNFRRCRSMAERQQTLDHHFQFAVAMKVVALIGFSAIEVSKIQRKKRHFTTWHGLLGLCTMITLSIQVVVGLSYHYKLIPTRHFPNIYPALRRLHFYLGLVLVVLVTVAMALGLQSHFAIRAVPMEWLRQLFAIATGALTAFVYLRE